MADWELLVPGIGLTVLGMAGVSISLAGVAKTFMEGMHAMSALMMFVGLIILAAGILKDGLPRGSQAKAAALVIVGIVGSFGAYGVAISGSSILVIYIGVLFLILLPAVVIAWAAHHKSPHFKAITILFSSASVVGIIAFTIFGAVAPQPIEAGVLEQPEQPAITGPTVEVTIPKDAAVEGNKAFDPEEITVAKGTAIVWTNVDAVVHTVTSGTVDDPAFGKLFDSSTIKTEGMYVLDTSKLETGEYVYFCTFHPFMIGKFIVSESTEVVPEERTSEMMKTEIVEVDIASGSENANNSEFYVPAEMTVQAGTTIVWTNSDAAGHTVTSGVVDNPDAWGQAFDSGFPLINAGQKYEFTFKEQGEYPYFCQVHPWMIGKVTVT